MNNLSIGITKAADQPVLHGGDDAQHDVFPPSFSSSNKSKAEDGSYNNNDKMINSASCLKFSQFQQLLKSLFYFNNIEFSDGPSKMIQNTQYSTVKATGSLIEDFA